LLARGPARFDGGFLMHVADVLKVMALGALLCACEEREDDDEWLRKHRDASTMTPAPDAGSPTVQDSGTRSDASTNGDGGAAGEAGADGGAPLARSMGSWVVYPDPYGDGGANPATGIQGTAVAVRATAADGGAGIEVTLMVSGLPNNREFGSHLHKAECDMGMAGGHYQHMAAPDGGATDPAFANPDNEVWLDFTTSGTGTATSKATVGFVPAAGLAKAIIVHDRKTGDGGVAGPKLACLPFAF
jgi:Cu-Zn family superoxide dismutase